VTAMIQKAGMLRCIQQS